MKAQKDDLIYAEGWALDRVFRLARVVEPLHAFSGSRLAVVLLEGPNAGTTCDRYHEEWRTLEAQARHCLTV